MSVNGDLIRTHGWATEWAYPRLGLPRPPIHPNQGSKSPRLKLQLNGWWSTKMSIEHIFLLNIFLALKWCHEQSYSLDQGLKWLNADRTQYVRSSSGHNADQAHSTTHILCSICDWSFGDLAKAMHTTAIQRVIKCALLALFLMAIWKGDFSSTYFSGYGDVGLGIDPYHCPPMSGY